MICTNEPRMRISSSLVGTLVPRLMTLSLVLAGVCGCEDGSKCTPCPSEETDGVVVAACKDWEGVYHGEMVGRASECGDASDLNEKISVDVLNIETDPQEEDVTLIEMKLTGEDGDWTMFSGWICATEDEEEPFRFTFSVSYHETLVEDGNDITFNNTLSGFFIREHDGVPANLEANYGVLRTVAQKPEENCTRQARLQAE